MLDSAQTIVTQIFIMFLLMLAGHLLYRRRIIDSQGSQQLSSLLLNIVTPAVLITSFQRPFDPGEAKMLATAFFFASSVMCRLSCWPGCSMAAARPPMPKTPRCA